MALGGADGSTKVLIAGGRRFESCPSNRRKYVDCK